MYYMRDTEKRMWLFFTILHMTQWDANRRRRLTRVGVCCHGALNSTPRELSSAMIPSLRSKQTTKQPLIIKAKLRRVKMAIWNYWKLHKVASRQPRNGISVCISALIDLNTLASLFKKKKSSQYSWFLSSLEISFAVNGDDEQRGEILWEKEWKERKKSETESF